MITRSLLAVTFLLFILGCYSIEEIFLDPGIPRVETDTSQIVYIRTKWMNDKHVETAFLDSQDRVLEVFRFGRSSAKTRHGYEGSNNILTIHFTHSDSSPIGWVSVDTLRRTFDAEGRVVAEFLANGSIDQDGVLGPVGHSKRYLSYTAKGDTILKNLARSYETTNTSTVVNIDRWEKDKKLRLSRHYRLYVMRMPDNPHDTVYHFSQRYAYDSKGRLAMAWFDYMYLGRFYMPAGPDTIWYSYGPKNRLVAERHRYTTSMSNKSEPDTTELSAFERESRESYRKMFFVGDNIFHNNDKVNLVRYEYERFDPKKHLPLKIPVLD